MKFRKLMILVVLLACGLPLYGQQARPTFQTMPYPCLQRPGLPPALMGGPCKPVLGDTQTSQPSSDLPRQDDSGTYITFDAPGAVNGTIALSINPAGAITGYYRDANFIGHGFLRTSDGTITTFDVPGDANGTYSAAINPGGAITGRWCDMNFVCPGFVRSPDGTITTFDVPGEVNGVYPWAVNPQGAITGQYYDVNRVSHGFLRTSDGTITTFDAPGAGTSGAPQGTRAYGITPEGTVAGCYLDANLVGHGFVRSGDGTLTTFDVPNSTKLSCLADYGAHFGGQLLGVNPPGAITGAYFEPIPGNPFGGNYRGFLRAKDGSFTTFDAVPSPSSPCCTWTFGIAINPSGEIAGFDNDYINVNHGFLRSKDGTVTILDAPGAGTGFTQGTLARSINPAGQIAGVYSDANSVYHGFVRIPH